MSWKGTLLVLLCLFLGLTEVQAKEVQAREVNLTLYNKPVTGYRVVLDRSTDFIIEKIDAHLEDFKVKPFRFEQTVIYENILYSPITETKEISLHYLLKNLENQLTEVTVVAMYDYKRSISSREFPDLSQRLLADLSTLTRKTNGATLKFQGQSFDSAQPENGTDQAQREEEVQSNNTIQHFDEEEVENNSVLLKKDPFQTENGKPASQDEVKKELEKQLALLQAWEDRLNKRETALDSKMESLERNQKSHQKEQDQYKILVDSIVKLQKDKGRESQYAKYAGDPMSFSLSEYILDQEELYSKLSRDYANLTIERDSQTVKIRNQEVAIAQADSRIEALNRDLDTERKAKNDIKAEWMVAKAQEGTTTESSTSDLMLTIQNQDSLQAIIDRQSREIAQLESFSNDFDSDRKTQDQKYQKLQSTNRDLRNELEKTKAELLAANTTAGNPEVRTVPDAGQQVKIDSLESVIGKKVMEIGRLENSVQKKNKEITLQKKKYQDVLDRNQEVQTELDKTKETLAAARQNPELREGANQSIQIQTLRDSYAELEALLIEEKEKNKQVQILRDSVKLLNVRMNVQSTSNPEIDRLKKELRQKNEDLQSRKTQVSTLKTNNDKLTNQVKSQKADNSELKKQLQMANQQLKSSGQVNTAELQSKIDKYDTEVKDLRKEAGVLRNQNTDYQGRVTTLENTLKTEKSENSGLKKKVEAKNNQIQTQRLESDSLSREISYLNRKSGEQSIEIADLQIRLDSIAKASNQPLSVQEQFIRQQRTKLDNREAQIETREDELARAQKRTDQREVYIKQREAELKTAEKRFVGLQKKEDELNIIEQQLRQNVKAADILDQLEIRRNGGKKPSDGRERFNKDLAVPIKAGKVAEFGRYVPLFESQVEVGVKTVQKKVTGYMTWLGHLYDEKFPDFIYEKIVLKEVAPDKLTLKVRLTPEGTGTKVGVSFRMKNGQYIDPDNEAELGDKARQFITRMLRFNL